MGAAELETVFALPWPPKMCNINRSCPEVALGAAPGPLTKFRENRQGQIGAREPGECRINRGQHRAARAVGARVARKLLAEVAALPRLGAGSRTGASGAQGAYSQDADRLGGAGLH